VKFVRVYSINQLSPSLKTIRDGNLQCALLEIFFPRRCISHSHMSSCNLWCNNDDDRCVYYLCVYVWKKRRI